MRPLFESLKKEKNFLSVRRAGRFWRGRYLRLTVLKTDESVLRIGIVVSKKVSNKAVVRNKVRRRLKNSLQKALNKYPPLSADMVISAAPQSAAADYTSLDQEINTGLGHFFTVEEAK